MTAALWYALGGLTVVAVLQALWIARLKKRLYDRSAGSAPPETAAVCDPCEKGFESEQAAVLHAQQEHGAPDVESAGHIISVTGD